VTARRKAAYLEFEDDPELDFEFFLAEKLHMSVARLRKEVPNDEIMRWSVYYGRKAQDAELAAAKAAQQARRR
jgi:hypothetical protein